LLTKATFCVAGVLRLNAADNFTESQKGLKVVVAPKSAFGKGFEARAETADVKNRTNAIIIIVPSAKEVGGLNVPLVSTPT